MKEIKFRYVFKSKDGEIAICVLTLQQIQDGCARETIDSKAASGFELISVSQFIGLLDKGGKEIFDGDIVNISTAIYYFGKYIVEYNSQECRYTAASQKEGSLPMDTIPINSGFIVEIVTPNWRV